MTIQIGGIFRGQKQGKTAKLQNKNVIYRKM